MQPSKRSHIRMDRKISGYSLAYLTIGTAEASDGETGNDLVGGFGRGHDDVTDEADLVIVS